MEGRGGAGQVWVPTEGWLGGAPRPSCVRKAGQDFCADPALVGFQAAHLSSKAKPLIPKDIKGAISVSYIYIYNCIGPTFVFLTGSGVGEGKEEKGDAKRGHTWPFEPHLGAFLVGDLSVNGHM